MRRNSSGNPCSAWAMCEARTRSTESSSPPCKTTAAPSPPSSSKYTRLASSAFLAKGMSAPNLCTFANAIFAAFAHSCQLDLRNVGQHFLNDGRNPALAKTTSATDACSSLNEKGRSSADFRKPSVSHSRCCWLVILEGHPAAEDDVRVRRGLAGTDHELRPWDHALELFVRNEAEVRQPGHEYLVGAGVPLHLFGGDGAFDYQLFEQAGKHGLERGDTEPEREIHDLGAWRYRQAGVADNDVVGVAQPG